MSGIDKLKEQIKKEQKDAEDIQTPKSLEEAKTICDIFKEQVQEVHRQIALENQYTEITRQLYLQVEELDAKIKLLEQKKTKKRVEEYEQTYNKLLEIQQEQQRLYAEIKKYREITIEQEQKGFI